MADHLGGLDLGNVHGILHGVVHQTVPVFGQRLFYAVSLSFLRLYSDEGLHKGADHGHLGHIGFVQLRGKADDIV